jgi:hypothetical protein
MGILKPGLVTSGQDAFGVISFQALKGKEVNVVSPYPESAYLLHIFSLLPFCFNQR